MRRKSAMVSNYHHKQIFVYHYLYSIIPIPRIFPTNFSTKKYQKRTESKHADPGAAAYSENSLASWRNLQPVIEEAEKISEILPFSVVSGNTVGPDMQATLKEVKDWKGIKFDNETVHIDLEVSAPNDHNSFLFVAPRYFRGIGLDEELPAYIEFCNIVFTQLKPVFASLDIEYKVTVLHPQLMDSVGFPVFSGRAPHPSILVTIVNK